MSVADQPFVTNGTVDPDKMRLDDVLALYRTVGKRDIRYLRWLDRALDSMTLPCINPDIRQLLSLDKTKVAVFDILQDDLADNLESRDGALLEDFIKIPWHGTKGKQDLVRAGQLIWDDYYRSLEQYPRFREFKHIFYFDWRQIISANLYSFLVNTLGMDNEYEVNRYFSYGLVAILFVDMDLMQLPEFDMAELGSMRAIAFLAQKVGGIANMLVTYPREVIERDFSSPIISMALSRNLVSRRDLNDLRALKKLEGLEPIFRDRARRYISRVAVLETKIRSINIEGFSEMLRDFVERWTTDPETRIVMEERHLTEHYPTRNSRTDVKDIDLRHVR